MAVATSTALAIGAVASSAGGAIMSFNQAAKQNRLMTQAQQDAANAMASARGLLQKNYMKGLSINKEPYELEREAALSQGAQAIEAGVESERGSAATAGRIQAGMNDLQAEQRKALNKDIQDINEKILNEESRLRDVNVELDLGEAEGAQKAARDAAEAKNKAIQSGMNQAMSAVGQSISAFVPLYGKSGPSAQDLKLADQSMKSSQKSIAEIKPRIGMIPGANNPTALSGIVPSTGLTQKIIPNPNMYTYPNQHAYNNIMYNPFDYTQQQ